MSNELPESTEAVTERPGPPPLRIHHLMACAVVTAVFLSLWRLSYVRLPANFNRTGAEVFAFSRVLAAVGLTLAGFSIYWRRKGFASFSQPGQILLLQFIATALLYLSSLAFSAAMSHVGTSQKMPAWVFSLPTWLGIANLLFGILLPFAFYIWCAWKIADTGPWRILFVLCAVTAVLTSALLIIVMRFAFSVGPSNIQMIIGLPAIIRGVLLLPIGAVAIASDLSAHRKRYWTHWAGVILWLLVQFESLSIGLYYVYLWRVA